MGVTAVRIIKSRLRLLMAKKSMELGRTLTQKELAEKTELSVPTIARWVSGDLERVEADTLGRLLEYFDCSMDDLVYFVDDEE